MSSESHGTRGWRRVHGPWVVAGGVLVLGGFLEMVAAGQEDVADLLKNAKPASAPTTDISPTAAENAPTVDALGTMKPQAPAGARHGTVTLNTGVSVAGDIWTTTDTPFRVWVEEDKVYRDVDLALVKRIDVKVISQTMEDDWRWLKEGSDQKVYSGKKYPNVELAYVFTLLNDQTMEGTVVAPVYLSDGKVTKTLALYKKYKGKLDEALKDLVYIQAIVLDSATAEATARNEKLTTKLPLLEDR